MNSTRITRLARYAGKLALLLVFVLILLSLQTPAAAAETTAVPIPNYPILFVGHDRVTMEVCFSDDNDDVARVEIKRDNSVVKTYYEPYCDFFTDTGLTPNQTVSYTKVTHWHSGSSNEQSLGTFIVGPIRGKLLQNTNWNGAWTLGGTLEVPDGVRLNIFNVTMQGLLDERVTVQAEPGSVVTIRNATLDHVSLNLKASEEKPTQHSVLHSTFRRANLSGSLTTFQHNTFDGFSTRTGPSSIGGIHAESDFAYNKGTCDWGSESGATLVYINASDAHHNEIECELALVAWPNESGKLSNNRVLSVGIVGASGYARTDPFTAHIHDNEIIPPPDHWLLDFSQMHLAIHSIPEDNFIFENNHFHATHKRSGFHLDTPLYGTIIVRNNTFAYQNVDVWQDPKVEILRFGGSIEFVGNKFFCTSEPGEPREQTIIANNIGDLSFTGNRFFNCIIRHNGATVRYRDNIVVNSMMYWYEGYTPSDIESINNLFQDTITWKAYGTNVWHGPLDCSAPNILGGPCQGGNYWSGYTGQDGDGDGIGDTPYDYNSIIDDLPLVGDPVTDLEIVPFQVEGSQVEWANGRFTLPITLTLQNSGPVTATQVAVEVTMDARQDRQIVPQLAPGTSAVVTSVWDITNLVTGTKGINGASITATADPDNAITEIEEDNNSRQTTFSFNPRPRITDLQTRFDLNETYFLANLSTPNALHAFVDWNGDLAGGGTPGTLFFELNGTTTAVSGQSWGATHTYDIGTDFNASFDCFNNTLIVRAETPEWRSDALILKPTVFPFPGWSSFLPGTFAHVPHEPLMHYSYDLGFPDPDFEAIWDVPYGVPWVGGEPIGIPRTRADLHLLGRSDGSGRFQASGQTGFLAAGGSIDGRLYGSGDVRFVCGESLDLVSATMGLEIIGEVTRSTGLLELIPGVSAAFNIPVAGRAVRYVARIAEVEGKIGAEADIVTRFREVDDQLQFDSGSGTVGLSVEAALGFEPISGLGASLFGGGDGFLTVVTPPDPDYLADYGLGMAFGLRLQMWFWEDEYPVRWGCGRADGCESDDGRFHRPAWTLIPRSYAPVSLPARAPAAGETTLATDIYPRPEPAIAAAPAADRQSLLFVGDDPTKPHGLGTEIYAYHHNGYDWYGPVQLTDDAQPDFAPDIAFTNSGAVAVWEHATVTVSPTLDIPFAQSLEIAAAASSNGYIWSTPITLTQDSLMDRAPQLAAAADGSAALAVWQTSDGTDLLGTAAHPVTLRYAWWDGSSWSAPATAVANLSNLLGVSVAAATGSDATLVYALDQDGDLATADGELYAATFAGGSWGTPTRLTDNGVADVAPAVAYEPGGVRHILWRQDGNLLWLADSLNGADAQLLFAGNSGSATALELTTAGNGRLAAAWQSMAGGYTHLAYTLYDPASKTWRWPGTLGAGDATRPASGIGFDKDGRLLAGYQLLHTDYVTQVVTLSPTRTITISNVPVPGASDLMHLRHEIGQDLALSDLTVTPAQAGPGTAVTVTAALQNSGDLAIANPDLIFYNGATPILTRTLPITLTGGATTTANFNWTWPLTTAVQNLRVVVDPADSVAETDERNNTATLLLAHHDLVAAGLSTTPAPDGVWVTMQISNAGQTDMPDPFLVTLAAHSPITHSLPVSLTISRGLRAGEVLTLTHLVTHTHPGQDVLWLTVDGNDAVAEVSEANNVSTAPLLLAPDLALAAADVQVGPAAAGNRTVTVTLHNDSVFTATNVTLHLYQHDVAGPPLQSPVVTTVPAGGTAVVTTTVPDGYYDLFVWADPDNTIRETLESNNIAGRLVPGEPAAPAWKIFLPVISR